jgi:hypothetical protein
VAQQCLGDHAPDDLYGEWRSSVSATMRPTHVAGEKLFVDFAGDPVPAPQGRRPCPVWLAKA